jgi:hypothetical protein
MSILWRLLLDLDGAIVLDRSMNLQGLRVQSLYLCRSRTDVAGLRGSRRRKVVERIDLGQRACPHGSHILWQGV